MPYYRKSFHHSLVNLFNAPRTMICTWLGKAAGVTVKSMEWKIATISANALVNTSQCKAEGTTVDKAKCLGSVGKSTLCTTNSKNSQPLHATLTSYEASWVPLHNTLVINTIIWEGHSGHTQKDYEWTIIRCILFIAHNLNGLKIKWLWSQMM